MSGHGRTHTNFKDLHQELSGAVEQSYSRQVVCPLYEHTNKHCMCVISTTPHTHCCLWVCVACLLRLGVLTGLQTRAFFHYSWSFIVLYLIEKPSACHLSSCSVFLAEIDSVGGPLVAADDKVFKFYYLCVICDMSTFVDQNRTCVCARMPSCSPTVCEAQRDQHVVLLTASWWKWGWILVI